LTKIRNEQQNSLKQSSHLPEAASKINSRQQIMALPRTRLDNEGASKNDLATYVDAPRCFL